MRLRTTSLTLVSALLLTTLGTTLGTTTAGAAPDDRDRPPRTQGSVTDARGDATGPRQRRPRADLTKVRYRMPLPRNQRTLTVSADLRRVGFGGRPVPGFGGGAPKQQVKTLLDGPGRRDWALTVYNYDRAPRLVFLGTRSGEPRQVSWSGAFISIADGGSDGGTLELQITTEWLRRADRLDLTSTGISGKAMDTAGTVERRNATYAGRSGSRSQSARAADGCETTASGMECSYSNG